MKQSYTSARKRIRIISLSAIVLFGVLMGLSRANTIQAATALAFTPPTTVQVQMFRLTQAGVVQPGRPLCISGDQAYGCTANPSWPYPYAGNPATVAVESDYLLNVVTKEISVSVFHPNAIEAIAAAARSYAYYYFFRGWTLNNSTESQAFLPFAFESLNAYATPSNPSNRCASTNLNADQTAVCNAVARRIYVSYPEGGQNDAPAFTEYFADIPLQTETNTGYPNYLRSISEPISQPPVAKNGHGHGLSQNGASRWAYGNLSFKNTLDAWSTQFRFTEQILTHYYSNVTIRNANQGNQPTVPGARWAPLKITWDATGNGSPPTMQPGTSYRVVVQVQNTSPLKWTCGYPFYGGVYLRYRLQRDGRPLYTGASQAAVCGLDAGADSGQSAALLVQLPSDWPCGPTALRLDINAPSTDSNLGCTLGAPAAASPTTYDFWFSQCNWPAYEISVSGGKCQVLLPLIQKVNNTGWPIVP